MKKEIEIFEDFLKNQGLKYTAQRRSVLEAFLRSEEHLSADELYSIIKKKDPAIGYATIHRTLKHIKEAGLAREVEFGDRKKRYEHMWGHQHHDHLVCIKCGRCVEILDPKIEQLQEKLARKHGFEEVRHRLEIFGYCRDCK